jgi:hypothetical protein
LLLADGSVRGNPFLAVIGCFEGKLPAAVLLLQVFQLRIPKNPDGRNRGCVAWVAELDRFAFAKAMPACYERYCIAPGIIISWLT